MPMLYPNDVVPDVLAGMRVVTNDAMTETRYRDVARTWRERLLSWPWRPWVALKTEAYQVPSSQVYRVGNTLHMHSRTLGALVESLPTWATGESGGKRAAAGGSGRTW